MTDATAHAEFTQDYERTNLMRLAGSVEGRAHLFSDGDLVLPHRKLHAASHLAVRRYERALPV